MTRRSGPCLAALSAFMLLAAPAPTPAMEIDMAFDAGSALRALQRHSISLDEAVAMVQSRYDAKVVKAETVEQRGRVVYRIRLLSADGRVWTVNVDAASGDMR